MNFQNHHSTGAHVPHWTKTKACGAATCCHWASSVFTLLATVAIVRRLQTLDSGLGPLAWLRYQLAHTSHDGAPWPSLSCHEGVHVGVSAILLRFMRPQHINPADAVQVHRDVQSQASIGIHWGTFCLTDEPMDEPPMLLMEEVGVGGGCAARWST